MSCIATVCLLFFFFSSRRRHTRCALVTGVQTCALPILGLAASHKDKGWEPFTDAVVAEVNRRHTPAVFMLWGSHAQKKAAKVDTGRHLVLKAPHPSPLSAHNGFFGCRHFSKAKDRKSTRLNSSH